MEKNYKDCKKTLHTNDVVKIEAPEGYHFETLDGDYFGNIVYDGLGAKMEGRYKLVIDNINDNEMYLKPFN